jgi:hypothetical protein
MQTEAEVKADHLKLLQDMPDEYKVVMARELLAAALQRACHAKDQFVTRGEALDAVFTTEAASRAAGASPRVDFFLPMHDDLPFVTQVG